jgi:hypothetical protein
LHPLASPAVAGDTRTPVQPLAEASRLATEARTGLRPSQLRRTLRAPIRAIDLLLDDLECVNLAGGAPSSSPEVVAWIARVEEQVGMQAPSWVHAVEDTVRLHAAVLRWQGILLDGFRPDRARLGDMHEDPIDLLLLPHAPLGPFLPGRVGDRIRRRVA